MYIAAIEDRNRCLVHGRPSSQWYFQRTKSYRQMHTCDPPITTYKQEPKNNSREREKNSENELPNGWCDPLQYKCTTSSLIFLHIYLIFMLCKCTFHFTFYCYYMFAVCSAHTLCRIGPIILTFSPEHRKKIENKTKQNNSQHWNKTMFRRNTLVMCMFLCSAQLLFIHAIFALDNNVINLDRESWIPSSAQCSLSLSRSICWLHNKKFKVLLLLLLLLQNLKNDY